MPGFGGGWVPPVAGGGDPPTDHGTMTGLDDQDHNVPYMPRSELNTTYLSKAGNLTGLADTATSRTNLGLGTAATRADAYFAQSANNLSDLASAATARTNLGLAIGTNVQAYDATLAGIAAVTVAANKILYTTGSDTFATADITAAGLALLDDASAAAQRTTLGLGTSAVLDAGTSAGQVVTNNDAYIAAISTAANNAATAAATAATAAATAQTTANSALDVGTDAFDEVQAAHTSAITGLTYFDLKARLDDMDTRIGSTAGPTPVTPGIYLTEPMLSEGAQRLIDMDEPQWSTFQDTDGPNGGGAPGYAGISAYATNVGTYPADFINNASSINNCRSSQRGTFRSGSLPASMAPLGWPAHPATDADANPAAVVQLRMPTNGGTNTLGTATGVDTTGFLQAYLKNGGNINTSGPGGTPIGPAGDVEWIDDSRMAFACAYYSVTHPDETFADAMRDQAIRFIDDWATTLTSIAYDSYKQQNLTPTPTAIGMSGSQNSPGSRIYGATKLYVAWGAEQFIRAASLIKTYHEDQWRTVNPTGPEDFANLLINVIVPHIAGSGGAGDSITRGWGGGNWILVMADAWVAAGIYLENISMRNAGLSYLRQYLPAVIFMAGDMGLSDWPALADSDEICPYPQMLNNNNQDSVSTPTSQYNTVAALKVAWATGSSATSTFLTFDKDGMNCEEIRDLAHMMLGLAGLSATCESMYHQNYDLYAEFYDRMVACYERVAKALYEYHTGGGLFWNGASGATGIENSPNWCPTDWSITPQNAHTGLSATSINNRNFSFELGGSGVYGGWELWYNHMLNRVGADHAVPGDPLYWVHKLFTDSATADLMRPSRPSTGIFLETLTHGNING